MLGTFRKIAQKLRHMPILREMNFLWDRLRSPYALCLTAFGAKRGVPVEVGGECLLLSPELVNMAWDQLEFESYVAFRDFIHPGDVIYDVGAHFGTYSLIGSRLVGAEGLVVSYEPNLETLEYFRRHIVYNRCGSNILLREACCGDRSGYVEFFSDDDPKSGASGLIPLGGKRQISVPMVRLDDEAKSLGRYPSLIKIDVEGGEMMVLQGAESILQYQRPVLLLSLHPKALIEINLSPDSILSYLRDLGYNLRVLSEDHEIHVVAQ
jgi:FkbM family methyltransferase